MVLFLLGVLMLPTLLLAKDNHLVEWKGLLFYFDSDHKKSLVKKGSDFFLSQNGHEDPLAELHENLKAFKTENENSLKLQCQFPARFNYLKKYHNLNVVTRACPKLEAWKAQMKSESIHLIFPVQFISNPASVMGHTFLRFSQDHIPDLYQQSVSYSARIPNNTGVISYIINGLFGGFHGQILVSPYHLKVSEYSDLEKRDMWEYELRLDDSEREKMTLHLWELLQNASFSYFFLTKNCSFFPLALIEAVRPELNLTGSFKFYLAPYMSIKRLQQMGLIVSEKFRPSIQTKLLARYHELSKKDKKQVLKSIKDKNFRDVGSAYEDTILDYILYKRAYDPSLVPLYDQTLLSRSKRETTTKLKIKTPSSPLEAHLPFQVDFGQGFLSQGKYYGQLKVRPGVHNATDKPAGFIPNSSFTLLEAQIRYFYEQQKFELSQYKLIEIQNLRTYSLIDPGLSWKFILQGRKRDVICPDCSIHEIIGYTGLSKNLGQASSFSLLIGIVESISSKLPSGHLTFLSSEMNLFVHFKRGLLKFSESISRSVWGDDYFTKSNTSIEAKLYHFIHIQLTLSLKFNYQKILRRDKLIDNYLGLTYDF